MGAVFYRTTRYAHWYDEQYQTFYIPFYTNISSIVLGMIAGLLYTKHKAGHIDLTKSKVRQPFFRMGKCSPDRCLFNEITTVRGVFSIWLSKIGFPGALV